MSKKFKPRLRFFESASGQQHIGPEDHYLYARPQPTHRINIIGAGTIGQEHMRVASLLGRLAVHGIYDSNAASISVATTAHKELTGQDIVAYQSLEAACNDPGVDALLICTPNFSHLEVLETALTSGKPIFIEKPMATSLNDAKRIVQLAQTHPEFIQVGLQYRYKAPYVEARYEILQRGTLGDVKTISMSEYRPPFLDKVDQWNKFSEFSGGTLVEKCCHYFDLISLLAQDRPSRVYASAGQAVNFLDFDHRSKSADIDDHAFVILDYENGLRASFTLNMFSPHFYEELVVCGEKGRLTASERFDFLREQSAQSKLAVELTEAGASRETNISYSDLIEQSGHHGATYFEHVAFADRLAGKQTDSATPIDGLWSVVVAIAAQKSAETGQAVELKPFASKHDLAELLY